MTTDPDRPIEPRDGPGVWWAWVLSPLVSAAAPPVRARVFARLRNTSIVLAVVVLLLPAYAGFGTSTENDRHLVALLFGAVAAAAEWDRRRGRRGELTVGALFALAVGVHQLAAGALWGSAAAAVGALSLGLYEARERWLPASAPPRGEPWPLADTTAPRWLFRIAETAAVVLVLMQFVFLRSSVSTGSMQPTIMGIRGMASGDSVGVNRTAFLLADPERWQIAVFEYPLFPDAPPFVKRVVGLPGERVEIRGGDIWVNGEIAVKPPLVQESLWQELFPSTWMTKKVKEIGQAWTLSEDDGWKRAGRGVSLEPRGDRPGYAKYRSRGLRNPDLRVSYFAHASEGVTLLAQIRSRGKLVDLKLPVGAPGSLTVDAAEPLELAAIRAGRRRVQLGVADGRARVLVDGRVLGVAELGTEPGRGNEVRFGAQGGPVRFDGLRLDQDVEYRSEGLAVFDVPDDGFVMLGDNSRESEDSRKWTVRRFELRDGRVLHAQSRVPLIDGTQAANIVQADGVLSFADVDGARHELALADIAKQTRGVPWPYARRRHLWGRGFCIVWPWTISGAGFRPRMLP